MHGYIKELKKKAEELNLTFRDSEWGEETSLLNFLLKGEENYDIKEYIDWATKEFNFKFIKNNHDELPEYDDWWQGHEEYAFSVIELNGNYFKLEYEVESYGGTGCEDYWNWKEATAVKREYTFFE